MAVGHRDYVVFDIVSLAAGIQSHRADLVSVKANASLAVRQVFRRVEMDKDGVAILELHLRGRFSGHYACQLTVRKWSKSLCSIALVLPSSVPNKRAICHASHENPSARSDGHSCRGVDLPDPALLPRACPVRQ